jgi:hypothetical protein
MKKLILTITLLIAPFYSFAETCSATGCIDKIQMLYVNADGDIYIGMPGDEKLANCTAVSGVYFTLPPNAENKKEVYSALLAAQMADKVVHVRVKEGTNKCEIAYITLDIRR